MKHTLALISISFSVSCAADWYAGARVGHAFVNNNDYPNIEKPMEYGGKFGLYSEKGIGVEFDADIVSGEKQGYSYSDLSSRSRETVIVNDSIKISCINYSVLFQARKSIFKELFCYVKAGAIVSSQEYNHFNSSNETSWKKTNGIKIGEVATIGGEYIFAKHVGFNASADYRLLSSKYNLNAAIVSAGISYHF